MTLPLSFCQPQLGSECALLDSSSFKSSSSVSKKLRRRPSGQRQPHRPAVLHVHAAATAARSQSDSADTQNSAPVAEQKNPWQIAANNIVSSFQRHRRENHLPLCRAFGVESLGQLRVSTLSSLSSLHDGQHTVWILPSTCIMDQWVPQQSS